MPIRSVDFPVRVTRRNKTIPALSLFEPRIGSPWRDCARQGSHTTGRAVFRIRRLNSTAGLPRKV